MKKILFLFIFVAQSFALTRGECRDVIRDMILDAGTTATKQHWSSTTINNYIDLAVQEIAAITWCQKNYYTFSISTGGVRDYSLQADIADVQRVTIHEEDTASDVSEKENCDDLEEATLASLDVNSSEWESNFSTYSFGSHGKPTKYYTYQSTSTYLLMGFDPPPDDTYTITVYYAEIPDDMTSDSDIPFRGVSQLVPYHDLICLWVAARFTAFDGKTQLSQYWYNQYVARLGEAVKSLNWKSNFSPNISGDWGN